MSPNPTYVPATDFYSSLGLHFELGWKLFKLDVLKPDAWLNQKPIFFATSATVEKAKTAVAHFRKRQAQREAESDVRSRLASCR